MSYDGHFCTGIHGAENHICLCPCERSQLEPLCVHASTHKYAFFISQMLLYIIPLCATSHMSVPFRVRTVGPSACMYISTNIWYDAHIHILTSLQMLHHEYFRTEPMLCELTYVFSLASAHTWNLLVYMHVLTRIHLET